MIRPPMQNIPEQISSGIFDYSRMLHSSLLCGEDVEPKYPDSATVVNNNPDSLSLEKSTIHY